MKKALCLTLLLCLALAPAAWAAGDVANNLYTNYKAGKPVPLPSQSIKGLDQAGAYKVQAEFVALLKADGNKVSGYKAGLTSAPAQKKFGAPGPCSGVLTEAMLFGDNVVKSKLYTKMMLEVELGYRFKSAIKGPVTARTVKQYVGAVMPAVEVPDLNFATFKGLKFEDIVAVNVGARGYVLGKPVDPAKVHVNKVTGKLVKNGKDMGPAVPARAALGNQWQALAWTVNNVLAHGDAVDKGMVIITGSLGRMYPGGPGSYQAVYTGGLGNLSFTVK